MSNARKVCSTAQSALSLGRKSFVSTKTFESKPFYSGTYGNRIAPSKALPTNATVQPSLKSQTVRTPDVNSSFIRGSAVSCDPEASQPDPRRYITERQVHTGENLSEHQSPFTRTGVRSQPSQTSRRLIHGSIQIPDSCNEKTKIDDDLRSEDPKTFTRRNSTNQSQFSSSRSPSGSENFEPTLTPEQYNDWAKDEICRGRITKMP